MAVLPTGLTEEGPTFPEFTVGTLITDTVKSGLTTSEICEKGGHAFPQKIDSSSVNSWKKTLDTTLSF